MQPTLFLVPTRGRADICGPTPSVAHTDCRYEKAAGEGHNIDNLGSRELYTENPANPGLSREVATGRKIRPDINFVTFGEVAAAAPANTGTLTTRRRRSTRLGDLDTL